MIKTASASIEENSMDRLQWSKQIKSCERVSAAWEGTREYMHVDAENQELMNGLLIDSLDEQLNYSCK